MSAAPNGAAEPDRVHPEVRAILDEVVRAWRAYLGVDREEPEAEHVVLTSAGAAAKWRAIVGRALGEAFEKGKDAGARAAHPGPG